MVLPTRGVTQKMCSSAGIYINQCTIYSYDFLQNFKIPRKILHQENLVESFHSKTMAIFLIPHLEKRQRAFAYDVRAFDIHNSIENSFQ